MIDRALLVRIEAKEGKKDEVESFLTDGFDAVREEDKTINWFAAKFGKGDFAIFDTFPDESERLAHLAGKVGRAFDRQDANIGRRIAHDRPRRGACVQADRAIRSRWEPQLRTKSRPRSNLRPFHTRMLP